MALEIRYEKERHTGRWIFFIILSILILLAGWTTHRWYTTGEAPLSIPLASADTSSDDAPIDLQQIDSYKVASNDLRYIAIPSLKVGNARVYPVGLDANNELELTANGNDASWYKKSTTPGSGGVIVLGVNGTSDATVFSQLEKIKVGAKIVITRGDKEIYTYTVSENTSMSLDEMQTAGSKKIGQSAVSGTEGLSIITTDGKFVPRLGTYDRRLLIRATLGEEI